MLKTPPPPHPITYTHGGGWGWVRPTPVTYEGRGDQAFFIQDSDYIIMIIHLYYSLYPGPVLLYILPSSLFAPFYSLWSFSHFFQTQFFIFRPSILLSSVPLCYSLPHFSIIFHPLSSPCYCLLLPCFMSCLLICLFRYSSLFVNSFACLYPLPHRCLRLFLWEIIFISVADPDPGCSVFLTPGSGM